MTAWRAATFAGGSARLFSFVVIAWIALEASAGASFGVSYLRGTLGDPDVQSVLEAAMMPVIVMMLPFAALAFGVFWPGMYVIGTLTRGRCSRLANVLIGAAFSLPVLLAIFALGRVVWPQPTTFVPHFLRVVYGVSDLWFAASILIAGMIAGAGIQTGRRAKGPTKIWRPETARDR